MTVQVDFHMGRERSGVVTIAADGQPTVELEDEVWHQLASLCRACAAVLDGRGATVRYFEMFGGYELAPRGDDVALTGAEIPTVLCDARALADAVEACARRYASDATATGDPDTLSLGDAVVEAADELRAALGRR